MVAVTYGVARVPVAKAAEGAEVATANKGFFARFYDALMESRLRQARREIARHAHVLSPARDDHGNRVAGFETDEMPFGGW